MKYLLIRHGRPYTPYNFESTLPLGAIDTVLFSEGGEPADPRAYSAVVVFGGYMYATEDDKYPWIVDELAYMERAMKAGTPLLGICLGGQLLARLLGARVYKTPVPEFGYWPLDLTAAGEASPLFAGMTRPLLGFLWHNDAFDLPSGATRLASTPYCPNQAFSYGERTYGLQFHLEFSGAQLRSMVSDDAAALPSPSAAWQAPGDVAGAETSHAAVRTSMLMALANIAELGSS